MWFHVVEQVGKLIVTQEERIASPSTSSVCAWICLARWSPWTHPICMYCIRMCVCTSADRSLGPPAISGSLGRPSRGGLLAWQQQRSPSGQAKSRGLSGRQETSLLSSFIWLHPCLCWPSGDLSKAQDMSKLRKGETKEPCISSFCKKTEPLSTRQIFSFAVN